MGGAQDGDFSTTYIHLAIRPPYHLSTPRESPSPNQCYIGILWGIKTKGDMSDITGLVPTFASLQILKILSGYFAALTSCSQPSKTVQNLLGI